MKSETKIWKLVYEFDSFGMGFLCGLAVCTYLQTHFPEQLALGVFAFVVWAFMKVWELHDEH